MALTGDLGEVAGLLLDVDYWRVTGLRVKVIRDRLEDLGLKRPLLGSSVISIPIDKVQAVSDRVVLRQPMDELSFTGGERAEEPGAERQASAGPEGNGEA